VAEFRIESDSLGQISVPPTIRPWKRPRSKLGYVDEATFDRVVDSAKMVKPYVAGKTEW